MIRRPPISPLFPYTPLSRPPAVPPAGMAVVGASVTEVAPPLLPMSRAALPPLARRSTRTVPVPTFVLSRLTTLERSEEHTSELQSQSNLVCRLLLEKKKNNN